MGIRHFSVNPEPVSVYATKKSVATLLWKRGAYTVPSGPTISSPCWTSPPDTDALEYFRAPVVASNAVIFGPDAAASQMYTVFPNTVAPSPSLLGTVRFARHMVVPSLLR